jgi:hypothetical protein
LHALHAFFLMHFVTEISVGNKHISGSPLPIVVIPAGNSVSTAIIRRNIRAGSIYQFDIATSDKYGNLLSSKFYALYGPRTYLVEMEYAGLSNLNTTTGRVFDRQGDFRAALQIVLLLY